MARHTESLRANQGVDGVRCEACGALNKAGAQWCGQCYARFDPGRAPAARGRDAVPRGPAVDASERAEGVVRGAFVTSGDEISWLCALCDSRNPIASGACHACGAAFTATLRPSEPELPERDPATAALLSLFLPGAGHAYAGLWGQAIARAVTSLWIMGVTLACALQRGLAAPSTLAFAAAAFALWAVSALDAYHEAARERHAVVLRDRYFIWAVLGLLGLSLSLVFTTAVGARP